MVAPQYYDSARETSIQMKLGARNYKHGSPAPQLYGVSVTTFGTLIEMIDKDDPEIVEDEVRVSSSDGKVFRFASNAGQMFYDGIVGCVEEMTNKGLYPKRYLERVIKKVEEDVKNRTVSVQFISMPNKHTKDQDAISAREQLTELLELCLVKKFRSRVTIHLEPLGELSAIYERGHRRHYDDKKGPPSHIKVKTSKSSNVDSKNSGGTPSKVTNGSRNSASKHSASRHSGSMNSKTNASTKKSTKQKGLKPFKIPAYAVSSKKILRSPEWHCIRIDPALPNVKIDPDTNCIPSWFANKPDEAGTVESHPLPSPGQYNDPKSFLNYLCSCPFDKKEMEKVLYQSFPSFVVPANMDATEAILPYLETAISKFAAVGIYIPPLQTLSANDSRGAWFTYMNQRMQDRCLTNYRTVIMQCLKNPKTKLMNEPIISAILTGCHDGYEAMYLLAKLGGHPRLQDTKEYDIPPIQTRDMNLLAYLQKWQAFLYKEFLNGIHYSQWYWLDTFLKNSHPEVRTHLNRSLEKELIKYGPSDILPGSIYPDKIIGRLSSINKSVPGVDILGTKPSEMKKNMVIRALSTDNEDRSNDDEESFLHAIMNAVAQQRNNNGKTESKLPAGCILCKGAHSVYNCPSIQTIGSSEQQLRLVLGALKKNNKTGNLINAIQGLDEESNDTGETESKSDEKDFQ